MGTKPRCLLLEHSRCSLTQDLNNKGDVPSRSRGLEDQLGLVRQEPEGCEAGDGDEASGLGGCGQEFILGCSEELKGFEQWQAGVKGLWLLCGGSGCGTGPPCPTPSCRTSRISAWILTGEVFPVPNQ